MHEIEYTVHITDEIDLPGDSFDNPEASEWVMKQIDVGNPWAWCVVEVRASVEGCGLQGSAYLGGCSYESEDEFRSDLYFGDMCDEAREDLERQLEDAARAYARLV